MVYICIYTCMSWHFPFTIYLYMSLSLKIIFNKNSLRFYFDNEFYYYYFLIKYISQYLKNFYIMTAGLPSTWICRWAQFCSYHDCYYTEACSVESASARQILCCWFSRGSALSISIPMVIVAWQRREFGYVTKRTQPPRRYSIGFGS